MNSFGVRVWGSMPVQLCRLSRSVHQTGKRESLCLEGPGTDRKWSMCRIYWGLGSRVYHPGYVEPGFEL